MFVMSYSIGSSHTHARAQSSNSKIPTADRCIFEHLLFMHLN